MGFAVEPTVFHDRTRTGKPGVDPGTASMCSLRLYVDSRIAASPISDCPLATGVQVGDLCEACLRGGSHAALSRVIERIQVEKQIIAKLDALVRTIAGVAPAEWSSAIKKWDRRKRSLHSPA